MSAGEALPKNRKKRWVKPRHKIVRDLLYPVLYPVCRYKYGARIEKFREQGDRQYLILFNHQTAFDQFFVSAAFKGAVYYLASEDILSNGFVSKLISFLAAPIPIKKQTGDFSAVLNCLRVAKEGGTLAMAPEGQRTYSGKTAYINPSVVPFARKLNLPIVFFRIEGGYGVKPRWSDAVRKGTMRAYVSRVLETEEYARMDDEALYREICGELSQDENAISGEYRSKRLAEHLERVLYVCPKCGFSAFESAGNTVSCKKCGASARMLPTKELKDESGAIPYRFVGEWYASQERYLLETDLSALPDEPVFTDRGQIRKVIVFKRKVTLEKNAEIRLYPDRLTVTGKGFEECFSFGNLSALTVIGKNKLNIYRGGDVYQIDGGKSFNSLKYLQFYCKFRNEKTSGGTENGEFLGL